MNYSTEYGKSYNWDESWKNAPHPRSRPTMNYHLPYERKRKDIRKNIHIENQIKSMKLDKNEHKNNVELINSRPVSKGLSLKEEIYQIKDDLKRKKQELRDRMEKDIDRYQKKDDNNRPKTAPDSYSRKKASKEQQYHKHDHHVPRATCNHLCQHKHWRHYPNSFLTEYNHKYQPYVFVPSSKMKSSSYSDVNKVPLRESHSLNRDVSKKQSPDSRKIYPKPSTEYDSNYKSHFVDAKHCADYGGVYSGLKDIKYSAEYNRLKDRRSHFSRNHLGQLESHNTCYWVPEYNRRNYENAVERPAAGKPSDMATNRSSNSMMWSAASPPSSIVGLPRSRSYSHINMPPAGKPTYDYYPMLSDYIDDSCSLNSCCSYRHCEKCYGRPYLRTYSCFKEPICRLTTETDTPRTLETSFSVAKQTLDRAKNQQRRVEEASQCSPVSISSVKSD